MNTSWRLKGKKRRERVRDKFLYICTMKKAVQLKVKGIVQGVFFRQSTVEKARELDINGWVRNCEDGSVELEAEGDENLLNVFIQWCHRGPRNAKVSEVERTEGIVKGHEGFGVKR
jgi:acylphosphatase